MTSAPSDLRNIGYPGGAAALGLLITARLLAAFYGHISDCDETYNYWEPLHYLGKLEIKLANGGNAQHLKQNAKWT